jgi:Tfp pilus assembly protein PilN
MIQFNLLPDVKLQYVRSQRLKRSVVSMSILVSGIALAVFIILVLTVDVWQKKSISDLNGDTKVYTAQLRSTPDLNKILTIQSQLNAINSLHDQKPVATRMFAYLSQVTPTTITISDLVVDNTQSTISITGNAPTLDDVNTFVDALKFTKYKTTASNSEKRAFSNVVLATFGRDSSGANYNITLSFDPTIFSSQNDISLDVPSIISTRSVVEQPSALFETGQ